MKKTISFIALLLAALLFPAAWIAYKGNPWSNKPEANKTKAMQAYWNLPLYFIENKGQLDEKVRFYEKGAGHGVFFTQEGVYISLSKKSEEDGNFLTETVAFKPINANKAPQIVAEEELPGKVNYFIGNDPKKWKTNIPTYAKVRYKEIYPGIDIVFYGNQRQLEYDIVVKPGADLSKVAFSYEGIKELKVNEEGNLVAILPSGAQIIQKKPHIYQEVDGKKVEVKGNYVVKKEGDKYLFSFHVPQYNPQYALVIDPVLAYSTYLGGSGQDEGYGIAVDSNGNVYVVGRTFSADFPTKNEYQDDKGDADVFVAKLDPSQSGQNSLIYSTYLGGSGKDEGYGIAVDSNGNVYVVGRTESTNFPTTNNAYQVINNGLSDAFVAKLSSQGNSLLYSTYLGGNYDDEGRGIAVDSSGNVYVVGWTGSTNFPTKNAYQGSIAGSSDAFVAKLDPSQSGQNSLVYSTYLGGGGVLWSQDEGRGIAVDSNGNVYVVGWTRSTNFPTKNAYQGNIATDDIIIRRDAFVAKLDPSQSGENSLVYSTYLGGSGDDEGYGIAVDSSGNVYVVGRTESTNFPTKNAYRGSNAGFSDAFVVKLSPQGNSLLYSTYLGGNDYDEGYGIAVDSNGNVYVVGSTESTNFPTKNAYRGSNAGSFDAFVAKLDPSQSGQNSLVYSTYLGGNGYDEGRGVAVDSNDNVYVVGRTGSTNFPTTTNAYSPNHNGNFDAFVIKILKTYTLTVNKSGTGFGAITSSPAGINCGSQCSASFSANAQVTLTATPFAGSTFGGWNGDCATCGNNTTCQITMDTDKTCTATFNTSSGGGSGGGSFNYQIPIDTGNSSVGDTIILASDNPIISARFVPTSITPPAGYSIKYSSAIEIEALVLNTTATATFRIIFPEQIKRGAKVYKIVGQNVYDITSMVDIRGSIITFMVSDNSIYDADNTQGRIKDPIVLLEPTADVGGGGGGGCSMVASASPVNALLWLLLPAFILARRYRRA